MSIYEQTERALALAMQLGGRDRLNCIAEISPAALDEARELDARKNDGKGVFLGFPILVKDNIDVKGLHTTAGSLALADHVANTDAPVIRNLRRNGAVILGKTNMTEFANYTTDGMPGGYSSRGGQVIHAINPALSPSGSSSGSAVAVAAGIVPAAVGTDTSFSIVACAQANGVCGLKPPAGALSPEGIIPIARTLDSAGTMARSFKDALLLYRAMRDDPLPEIQPAHVKTLKIAINTANENTVSTGQLAFLRRTLTALKNQGAHMGQIEQLPTPYQRVIMQCEFKAHLEAYLRASRASRKTLREIVEYYEAHPQTMMKYGITHLKRALEEAPDGLNSAAYVEAMEIRKKAIAHARACMAEWDAVIMTGPTNIMHFCGFPCVTVTGSCVNEYGVPRGLIVYGTDEVRLYQTALALEKCMQNCTES